MVTAPEISSWLTGVVRRPVRVRYKLPRIRCIRSWRRPDRVRLVNSLTPATATARTLGSWFPVMASNEEMMAWYQEEKIPDQLRRPSQSQYPDLETFSTRLVTARE